MFGNKNVAGPAKAGQQRALKYDIGSCQSAINAKPGDPTGGLDTVIIAVMEWDLNDVAAEQSKSKFSAIGRI